MKTTGGFKLWQIIYPIGIYYVVSSLMYFVLGLFLGDGQQTYMRSIFSSQLRMFA